MKTLECLESILNSDISSLYEINVYLVDDGSTDGTRDSVVRYYPKVRIISGDGTLYWNGGMRLAWKRAIEECSDYYLWINDDVILYNDSISRLLESCNEIGSGLGAITGTMVSSLTSNPTYGGRKRESKFNMIKYGAVLAPSLYPIECDFINGNFTLIPSVSVKKIGILSSRFTHSMGDFDYGLRLKKAGLNCYVAPGVFGECEENSVSNSPLDTNISLSRRLVLMKDITKIPPINEWRIFIRRHAGLCWPLHWVMTFIRAKFPVLWLVIHQKTNYRKIK